MKTLNFLLASLFLVFLLSSTSAVSVSYGEWAGASTITDGQSAVFNYDFYHYGTSSMQVSVKLYDTSNNLVYTFVDTSTSSASYYNTVSITESIYQNPGTYSLTFYSTDSDNAPSAITIYLTVNPVPDTTAPVITLIGSNPQTIVQGNAYTELGATASDNKDGDLTSRITRTINVNTNVIGTHYVTYSVLDNAGNSATTTRTINVIATPDSILPVISLLGNASVTIERGSSYSDAGATASDNIEGNITSRIVTSNPVNTNVLGAYTITYNVQDSSGNSAVQVTRTVNVIETIKPIVKIIFPEGKTYSTKTTNLEVNITDANLQSCWYKLNGDSNVSFACNTPVVITAEKGKNTLVVYANDSSGNVGNDSVSFNYKKKSNGGSGGSSGSSTVSTIKDSAESVENIVIPVTNAPEKNTNGLFILYCFMIATTTLGIIILSIILVRRLKEIKK